METDRTKGGLRHVLRYTWIMQKLNFKSHLIFSNLKQHKHGIMSQSQSLWRCWFWNGAWWNTPLILSPSRWSQEHWEPKSIFPIHFCAFKASLGYMRPCCKRNHLAQTKGILCWEPVMLGYLLRHFKVCECYTRTASQLKDRQRFPTASCHRLRTYPWHSSISVYSGCCGCPEV